MLKIDTSEKKLTMKEPGCACAHAHTHDHHEEEEREAFFSLDRILLIAGMVIFIGALVIQQDVAKLILFLAAYLLIGGEVLLSAVRNIIRGRIFDENFLMSLATIGAIAIGEYPEAVSVMLFYRIGEEFQDAAVNHSRRSIRSLLNIKPDRANLLTDGRIITVHPEELKAGDTIIVKPGERVPVDGIVLEGRSELDVSALTGESLPKSVLPGSEVLSGSINAAGTLTLRVQKAFAESTVSRILELVENASGKKAPVEQFITRFARVYTPIVVAAAAVIAFVPPLVVSGAVFSDWLYRGLIFLVISCPCALVISIPLSFFGGIGGASRKGILVKGGGSLEALKDVDTVVFDKTGTITRGDFKVSRIMPANGIGEAELLELAAHAEYHSNHPIARSILTAYGKEISRDAVSSHEELTGMGIRAVVRGSSVLAGNTRLMISENVRPAWDAVPAGQQGIAPHEAGDDLTRRMWDDTITELSAADAADDTMVHVARDGVYCGYLEIADDLKVGVDSAVKELKALGVNRTVILSGDRERTVANAAQKAGISEYYPELLPHQKVERIEEIMKGKRKGKTAFVGDGINDAPVLARADVGIAMGAIGSDSAIEAADVVLMTDELSKVAEAITIARKTNKIVVQNISMALAIKILVLLLGSAGLAGMWEAVFADVGAALLAVFNSMRVLK
ncbi:MAG TPA: heavy metal translocating P-type ATPase [Candidatus Atribacteria bacterium]|nr:heavy metal translocating P-type ATPase [Candidatus Atribacteria bacterium]